MARSFNGSTDQINTANSITTTTAATVAGWAYATSLPNGYQVPFSLSGVAIGGYWALYVKSDNNLAIYNNFGGSSGAADTDPWPSSTFPTGVWTHLALTTLSSGNMVGYINGVQKISPSASGSGASTSLAMTVGWDSHNSGRQWNGRIADIGTWNVQLTALEIAALARGVRPGRIRRGSLLNWLPINGDASPEPDLSGNAINGVLTGTAKAFGPPITMFTPWRPQFVEAPTAPTAILMAQIML